MVNNVKCIFLNYLIIWVTSFEKYLYHLPINLFSKIFFFFLIVSIRLVPVPGEPRRGWQSLWGWSWRTAWAIQLCSTWWNISPALTCQLLTVVLLSGFHITHFNSLSILGVNVLGQFAETFPFHEVCFPCQMFALLCSCFLTPPESL